MIKRMIARLFNKVNKRNQGKLVVRNNGLVKQVEDPRDFKASEVLGDSSLPSKYQLVATTTAQGFVKNQGNWNSCASHAICTAIELLHHVKKTGLDIPLSERYHYYFARKLNGRFPGNEGMQLRDMFKIAYNKGITPEQLCEYDTNKMNDSPAWFTDAFAKWWKIKQYFFIEDINLIMKAISTGRPVIAGIYMSPSFRSMTGPIVVNEGEKVSGGHAIVIYGYDSIRQELLCINSWGNKYKEGGVMSVPFGYWRKYNLDSGSCDI